MCISRGVELVAVPGRDNVVVIVAKEPLLLGRLSGRDKFSCAVAALLRTTVDTPLVSTMLRAMLVKLPAGAVMLKLLRLPAANGAAVLKLCCP